MIQKIADNVFVDTEYDGVNVGLVITERGVIAIDMPSYPRDARDWVMQIHQLSPHPPQALLLTDSHGDRLINSRWLNAPLYVQTATAEKINSYDKKYPHALLESLTARNHEKGRDLHNSPVERPSLSFSKDMWIYKGSLHIHAIAMPGPAKGSTWVYIPQRKVLFVGDAVTINSHPLLSDGSILEWLTSLKTLQQWPHPIQTIVPGRGPVCTVADIQPVIDYIQLIINHIETHIQQGKSREELTAYLPELLAYFPANKLPIDWLKKQIRYGLAQAYDEIKLKYTEHTTPASIDNTAAT